MGEAEIRKGYRAENETVHLINDDPKLRHLRVRRVPISGSTRIAGQDVWISAVLDRELRVEVKVGKQVSKTIYRYLEGADLARVRRDRERSVWLVPDELFLELLDSRSRRPRWTVLRVWGLAHIVLTVSRLSDWVCD